LQLPTGAGGGARIGDAGSQKLMLTILERKYKTTLLFSFIMHIHVYWPSVVRITNTASSIICGVS